MVSMYNELDMVIRDYVGFCEEGNDMNGPSDDCADPVLHKNITEECTMHLNGSMPLDKMSHDARYCITEWEEMMKDYPVGKQSQYEFDFKPKKEEACQTKSKSLVKSVRRVIRKLSSALQRSKGKT